MHQALQTGAVSLDEVLLTDRQADRAQAELAQQRLLTQENYNALTLLAGRPLPESLFEDVSLSHDWQFPMLAGGIPSDVLRRRPDVVAAEYALKAANARIGAARAAFFPSISITAEGGSSSAELSKLMTSGTTAWSFVPTVNLPIFDGGKNKATLGIAELNKKVEVVNYQKTIKSAFRDVSDALAGQSSLKSQLAYNNAVSDVASRQYDMAVATHDAGQISKESVLQKNNELLGLQQQQLDTRLRYLTQSVKLFSVLGGDSSL